MTRTPQENTIMQRLKDLAISRTGFVFDPYSGATFSANPSAVCILEGLREGLDRSCITDMLRVRFDAPSDDIARDIDDLVQSLRLYGLAPTDWEVP